MIDLVIRIKLNRAILMPGYQFSHVRMFGDMFPQSHGFVTLPVIIIIIIIKKDWQCKAGRRRLTPYQPEDPSPTLPTYRGKEEKGKIVEDIKGESN